MEQKLDTELLKLLVCPLSRAALEYDAERAELRCSESGLAYPVRDGIPVLLPEEARQIDSDINSDDVQPAGDSLAAS